MAGKKFKQSNINDTLLLIIQLLNRHDIDNWFVGYGTLLGIIRDGQCIDGDDDVDIVIDARNYDILKQILTDSGVELEYGYGIRNSQNIVKTVPPISTVV